MICRVGVALAVVCMLHTSVEQRARAELGKRCGPIVACHPKQRDAIEDPAKYRAWQCDRRAGKTTAAVTEVFQDARDDSGLPPDLESVYIALTRDSAERIAWNMAKQINRDFACGATFSEQKLRVLLPRGCALTLAGADAPHWIDRFYGRKLWKVYIDEAAFFTIDLYRLVFDVFEPAVADLNGTITLMSRPGHFKQGLFWRICSEQLRGWSLRKFSWRDNVYVRDNMQKRIDERIAENPDLVNDPSFRRNYCNEWVDSQGEIVYRFDYARNGVDRFDTQSGDHYVLGIDLGWHDHTAFSLITWSSRHDKVVELESFREREILLDAVAARARMYLDEYPGVHIVGDPDKRQAFEELRQRYDLPIQAADKSDKRYWQDQINNDLLSGRIQIVAPDTSPHADEMTKLVWEKRRSGKHIEKPGEANDACDAFLYAYRYAYHFAYREPEQPARPTEKERLEREAAEMEAEAEAMYRRRKAGPWG